jgi:hypothetical protein
MERVLAACDRPMLGALLSRMSIVREDDAGVELGAEPAKRAMVESNLVEIKSLFRRVTGKPDLSVTLAGAESEAENASEAPSVPAVRTTVDQAFDHPLVKQVAAILDAQPRRVEPKGVRSS